ncbi:MAG: AbrB/MazE/SpoVT family DNA-binding domain-containing protein [Promethearchaeota archaeon]|nr:MAG: AbrB/MazE/SpoVT family DNA-binding domain-containing protein [Candidatus Lokiarchaeota archaeon]
MIFEKTVKVTNRGMICIPASLRKKYNIKDGDDLSIIEDEDGLKIILIEDIDSIRQRSISAKKMFDIMEKSRKEELELEY